MTIYLHSVVLQDQSGVIYALLCETHFSQLRTADSNCTATENCMTVEQPILADFTDTSTVCLGCQAARVNGFTRTPGSNWL